jgi:hypothetical protein
MPPLIPPQPAPRRTRRRFPGRWLHARGIETGAPLASLNDSKTAGQLLVMPHARLLARGRDRRHRVTDPTGLRPAAARRGFFGRLARGVRSVGPPLTADQQLRLLQLALNVKLKREGKPPDSIRLTMVEALVAEQDLVAVGPTRTRPATPPRP